MNPRAPQALKRSLNALLRAEAARRGREQQHLMRELFLQVFLGRVFSAEEGDLVLKGGSSLVTRLPDARYSQDIDLLHLSSDLTAAAELEGVVDDHAGRDPFTFLITKKERFQGNTTGMKITVEARCGPLLMTRFPIDLSTERVPIGDIELYTPRPVIDLPEIAPYPQFALYPLPQQVADKLCAMYERHGRDGTAPSSRYRDLVDLVLIIDTWTLRADHLTAALRSEAQRRQLTLPTSVIAPGPQWPTGYAATAKTVAALSPTARTIDQALNTVGRCLNPILDGTVSDGTWDPATSTWNTG
ncbi:nucleotidyl transferase AbiEii/AbiGii toxin family protein [Rhodococcus sp. NCIMB 12038]|uniref:nucleotidyl transferase AbiEii/AbiGii toxin family protein n=1 Tax=Rhodococcus sp. NCIMB 12038 TaxID=933800 RepID=UPI000B3CDEB2|nr:nucleotidyl transferase AbiEii/AbiGii toxin family protein [Rhodococcus sp. NCIMB 12038]OUS91923.1 hypothetical protein CA951_31115 [Rhodococcus sp. NCIMB 12038]